ncbi:MAG: hypothetical protein KGL29_03265 [Alphaproteobacteria bacterium]|nr:hypothetical protein [Alphaproteobacteria bacterium]MDE2264896.1 hypothetical protein [Alphaproteobacteria bacterium]
MKRQALILLCVLTAAGCGRWADLDSDAFAQGQASQERFSLDAAACKQAAENERSYSIRGLASDNVEKHGVFNRAYAACMKAKGYAPRTSLTNFWEAYDL